MIKKGAMFGLDARIALAIFGALSLISGAALYSAIEKAKVTSVITEMNEVSKAVEAFLLDTGRYPTSTTANFPYINAQELVDGTGITGWQGPYLSYVKSGTANQLIHPKYDSISLNKVRNADWADWTDAAMDCPSTYSGACSMSIWFLDLKSDSLLKAIETQIDGTTSPSNTHDYTGKFRYVISTGRAVLLTIPYDKSQSKS
jgi:type II secretory pathway pseudopilin PulG